MKATAKCISPERLIDVSYFTTGQDHLSTARPRAVYLKSKLTKHSYLDFHRSCARNTSFSYSVEFGNEPENKDIRANSHVFRNYVRNFLLTNYRHS